MVACCGWGKGQEHRSGLQAEKLDLVLQEVEGSINGNCPGEPDFWKDLCAS